MIFLAHTTEKQPVYIPKTARHAEADVFLKLFSTMSLVGMVAEVELIEDTSIYHLVNVKLPSAIGEGEYEYDLLDKRGILSTGIAVVGEPRKVVEYNNAITYEQYE